MLFFSFFFNHIFLQINICIIILIKKNNMGSILLTTLGFASLILMVIGVIILHHDDTSDPDHHFWLWCGKSWIGALCLVAGWFFSSAYGRYSEVKWPEWPFVTSFNNKLL